MPKRKKINKLSHDERKKLVNKIARVIIKVQGGEIKPNVDIYDADYTNAHPRTLDLRQASIDVLNTVEDFLEGKKTSRRLTLEEMFSGGEEDK